MSQGYCFVVGSVSRGGFVTRGSATTFVDLPLFTSHICTKQPLPPESMCITTRSQATPEYRKCVRPNVLRLNSADVSGQ